MTFVTLHICGLLTFYRCVCIRNVILHHFRYKEVRYYFFNYVLEQFNAVEST